MLNNTQIKLLKPINKTKRYKDRDGLTLEVRPSGNKVFIFRFQWDKKPQTITVGHYPALSLLDARNIAVKYRNYLKNGVDPRESNKKYNKEHTIFATIADQWYNKNCQCWREVTQKNHKRSLEKNVYPIIGNIPINEITKADLLQIILPHEALGHYEVAHRLFSRIKAIFDYAISAGIIEYYPLHGLKNALAPKPKIKNQLAINTNEAHEMLDQVRQSNSSAIVKLYIELLAHLFVRPAELRLAKWFEFDIQKAEWNIPTERMKLSAPHWVPLTVPVILLLKELRLLTGFSPYLFNSLDSRVPKPISEASARKLFHKLGYKDRHTLHGFRSLASTVLHEQSSFRTDAIEAQLAHKIQGVRGVYLRADFKQERREMMEWYSKWISTPKAQNDYFVQILN